ncbi:V-type ATP synthase subunit A [Candidatus Micrarchaeota archaeon CG_4_10_14_0_2_um_filter_60_11]|nr:MAG: V-type ATP synthase subunit A [Candidatus Micrarchaeota archaeon CG1_02_60_51]PIN96526.1 MAG: V-type ATP synthase subunit A [Candidatus Micrarchaeota archaeon CG10_big_fil_rev_8_21_14_0_10_60_32]PIO02252.1 MAG: V-type ATP synthase subunit A [Candidatus Micrarchaeota archaeon CG09_land_8_20_14_0_10_60_16]PIZ91073.1 MAG: V-type ATP synthase subunit A [Candidatus Micrarchaeota archaeon CG_4_10_14_0_2_um_filter_60_11]
MGKIAKVSGPLIVADEMRGSQINEVVKVGDAGLLGEIIALKGDTASIQVYEDTSGLKPDDAVKLSGAPLQVELGPGLLGTVFDGIQRPLNAVKAASGAFIKRGIEVPSLDRKKKWDFKPAVKKGDVVEGGDVLGTVQEYNITHRVLVPPKMAKGKVESIESGAFTVDDDIAVIGGVKVQMMQKWSVRVARPYKEKKPFTLPLVTGKRIIDTFFPVAKGGTSAIPGPFGSGKTVNQQDLAKYADAEIIVYIGCGERGNEMTEVLAEFPHLIDPSTGKPLMERTVLIANTSNMPVAAREASIYTGITIAEYFRDMGYSVALMADSTSRWAEALREISGRLEEMPGEEGYPAYLGRKLAEFYERGGRIACLGSQEREGAITVVGAVSPPGGDISEPVSQGTLRITKVFWCLDSSLSRRRHYPAINWLKSYSLYHDDLEDWFEKNVSADFPQQRKKAMELLQKEEELQNIVQLIGPDALPEKERLILEAAKMIREDFLQQNSFEETDCYTTPKKQYLMLKAILHYYDKAISALAADVPFESIVNAKEKEQISQLKRVPEKEIEAKVNGIIKSLDAALSR